MGTFHHDKGELHGITVAVDTRGAEIWIGRCDVMTDDQIVLLDADVHTDGHGKRSKADYLKQAAMVGHWKKHDRVVLPLSQVSWVKKLGEL